jgi:hypothetical protein
MLRLVVSILICGQFPKRRCQKPNLKIIKAPKYMTMVRRKKLLK